MQIESKLIMGNFSDIPNPDLSILIPTYGRAKYLEKAIESALAQKPTRCKVEIIIVSNDPDDAMTDLIDKYKIKKTYLSIEMKKTLVWWEIQTAALN